MPAPPYPASDADARKAIVEYVQKASFAFGSWGDLKRLYKVVEADPAADPAVFAAFAVRFNAAPLSVPEKTNNRVRLSNLRHTQDMVFDANHLYLLRSTTRRDTSETLTVYEMASGDPLKPRKLGDYTLPGAQHLALSGNFVLASNDQDRGKTGALQIYDLSDPQNLRLCSLIETNGAGAIACHGHYAYVAVRPVKDGKPGFSGLRVVSFANPYKPKIVAELAVERTSGLALSPDGRRIAMFAEGKGFSWSSLPKAGGVQLIDVSDPTRPRLTGKLDQKDVVGGQFTGNFLLLRTEGQNSGAVQVYNIVDSQRPKRTHSWKSRNNWDNIMAFACRNGYVYIQTQYGSLVVCRLDEAGKLVLAMQHNQYEYGITTLGVARDILYQGGTDYRGSMFYAWNIINPAKPVKAGTPPSPETIGYLKRRVRRYLRNLSKSDPARFIEVASAVLADTKSPLDPAKHWVVMDLLYASSDRYYQSRHGRGGYLLRENKKDQLVLRRREERRPELWDQNPERLADLVQNMRLPWQVHEFAVRGVRNNGRTVPAVKSDRVLSGWLKSGSPLLVPLAARLVAERLTAEKASKAVEPEIAAEACYRATAPFRTRMIDAINSDSDAEWTEKFAKRLGEITEEQGRKDGRLTRRAVRALSLVAQLMPSAIAPDQILALLPEMVSAKQEALLQLILAAAEKVNALHLTQWVGKLTVLDEADREPVLAALEQALADTDLQPQFASALVLNPATDAERQLGWRLLAASKTSGQVLGGIWGTLLDYTVETDVLRSAMASPYALSLLGRSGISGETIAAKIKDRPFLGGLVSGETFRSLAERGPAGTLLQLMTFMPEERWQEIRTGWLRLLREGVGLADLWTALPGAVESDDTGRMLNWLVEDPEFSEVLVSLDTEYVAEIVAIKVPELDGLVSRWAERHANAFPKESAELREAATHVLPGVREWGLKRAQELGFGMPFALRLLESEIPASVAAGKSFFEAVPPGGERELDYALALCDSPMKAVRRYGRAYATARKSTMPQAELYRALFENPDPEIQTWLADLLTGESSVPAETTEFHRDVLRQRNRARKAKEAVKVRQTAEPTVDVQVLLEMARSKGNPRDAEWALAELAKRAMAGEEIFGFSLEGVVG
ncbi:MAG: hypothetical protein OHK0029_27070 [Armatimonadaceae bacterium]